MFQMKSENEIGSDDWNAQVFEQIYQRALTGDADSQFHLGRLFSGQSKLIPLNAQKQVEWYEKAAKQAHWGAMNNLGLLYENGIGVEKSDSKAFELFNKAARNEDGATAQFNLGRCYEYGIGITKNLEEAFKWYKVSAMSGSSVGNFKCGVFLFDGVGRVKNRQQAFNYFKKAAENEHLQSIYMVGYCLQKGLGTNKSNSFLEWYQKAADAGHARANLILNKFYEDGVNVPADDVKANHYLNQAAHYGNGEAKFKLYKKLVNQWKDKDNKQKLRDLLEQSAESGYKDARHALIRCLLLEDLFPKNVDRALQMMESSVNAGDREIYCTMSAVSATDLTVERKATLLKITKKCADLFDKYAAFDYAEQCEADGSEKKLKEALHYYLSAAALGHYAAASNAARFYQLGIGCDKDGVNEAGIIYYHLAFTDEHRSIESLAKLAEFFANGVRVPKNYIFAYALSNFSSSVGVDATCALRDSLETKMSPEQVGKAQDMSLEWSCLSQIKDHKFFLTGCVSFPNICTWRKRLMQKSLVMLKNLKD